MAVITLGTVAATSLNGIQYNGNGSISAADLATFNTSVKHDRINSHAILPVSFMAGILYFPDSRGKIYLRPGDWIAFDTTGFPTIIGAAAMGGGGWVHS
jgi:hypothetical protein